MQVDTTHLVQDSESLNIAAQMLAVVALNSLNQWNKKAINMSSERKGEKTHLCDRFSHPHASSQPEAHAKSHPAARSANSNYLAAVLQVVGSRPSQFTP